MLHVYNVLNTNLNLLCKMVCSIQVNGKVTKSRDQLRLLEGCSISITSNTFYVMILKETKEGSRFAFFQGNKTLWKFWDLSMSLIPFGESQVGEEHEDICAHMRAPKKLTRFFVVLRWEHVWKNSKKPSKTLAYTQTKELLQYFHPLNPKLHDKFCYLISNTYRRLLAA